jgi:peptidoglycan/LPS O-acetylase OafA/YrhL
VTLSKPRTTWLALKERLKPLWPLWPLTVGAVCFAIGVVVAPKVKQDSPPAWFSTFFPAMAGAIVAIGVGVAIGGVRYGVVSVRLTAAVLAYFAIGAAACFAAIDTSLPAWLYKFLLGAGIGAGVACLVMLVVVGTKALKAYEERRRADNARELEGRVGQEKQEG